jgi:hypothetical protein
MSRDMNVRPRQDAVAFHVANVSFSNEINQTAKQDQLADSSTVWSTSNALTLL